MCVSVCSLCIQNRWRLAGRVDTRALCSKVEINIYRAASPQPKSTAKSNGGLLVDSAEGVAFGRFVCIGRHFTQTFNSTLLGSFLNEFDFVVCQWIALWMFYSKSFDFDSIGWSGRPLNCRKVNNSRRSVWGVSFNLKQLARLSTDFNETNNNRFFRDRPMESLLAPTRSGHAVGRKFRWTTEVPTDGVHRRQFPRPLRSTARSYGPGPKNSFKDHINSHRPVKFHSKIHRITEVNE